MFSKVLLISLLCGSITCQTPLLLNATVGGSVLFPCVLQQSFTWFYWQEEKSHNILYHGVPRGEPQSVAGIYKDRVKAADAGFSSGDISIVLHNVSFADDQKTFCVYFRVGSSDRRCGYKLQVSAPYSLSLTVNSTAATCTARGGYPEPRVSWSGVNRSSSALQQLHELQRNLDQDPEEKTFTVTSSVSVREFQSVTCIVSNPRTNQSIEKSSDVPDDQNDDDDKNKPRDRAVTASIRVPVVLAVLAVLAAVASVMYKRRGSSHDLPPPAAVNEALQDQGTVPAPTAGSSAEPNGDVSQSLTEGTTPQPSTSATPTGDSAGEGGDGDSGDHVIQEDRVLLENNPSAVFIKGKINDAEGNAASPAGKDADDSSDK